MDQSSTSAKRAVVYARISLDASGEGKAIERQIEDCTAFARLRGWQVVAVEQDSVSAYREDKRRPGWERVKEMLASREAEVVVAWRLDRLTRRTGDLVEMIRLAESTGASIATTDGDLDLTTPTGRGVAKILASMAEMEVEVKGQRQRRANEQRAREGRMWSSGWRPFGYELDGTQRPEEAALIKRAATDALGGKPLREIAREWRASGVSTPRSAKGADGWTHNGVKTVLQAPRNAGWVTYRGERVASGIAPILTDAEHAALVAMFANPDRRTNSAAPARGRKPSTLLSGIAKCADCGEFVGGGSMGTKGNRVPIYQCRGYHVASKRDEMDALVISSVRAALRLTSPGSLLPIINGPDQREVLDQVGAKRTQLASLGVALAHGDLDPVTVASATHEIRRQIEELEAAITTESRQPAAALRAEQLAHFDSLDLDGQRRVLSRLADITLYPKRRKRLVPAAHQVTVFLRQTLRASDEHAEGYSRLIPALNERPANTP